MKQWDVFISHASEDKAIVAIPLAEALTRAGLKVWLDKFEISLGDSIREKVDQGLATSRYGVLILSPSFIAKGWPKRELNALMTIEEAGEKVILPVWHNIDKSQLTQYSPILADRLAANTSNGIFETAQAIINVVLYRTGGTPSVSYPSLSRRFAELLDGEPDPSTIRGFLASHPKALGRALDVNPFHEAIILENHIVGGAQVDLCVLQDIGYQVMYKARLIMLDNPARVPFEGSDTPVPQIAEKVELLKTVLSWMETHADQFLIDIGMEPSHKRLSLGRDAGYVIAGRREKVTPEDGRRLANYNHFLSGIEVRTYGWLQDALLAFEQDSE